MSSVTTGGIACQWCGKPLFENPPHTNMGCGQAFSQRVVFPPPFSSPIDETNLRDLIRRIVREELVRLGATF